MASQQTNSGRVRCCLGGLCPKLASFEIFDVCMYITAFASISSMALEIEAFSFLVLEKQRGILSAHVRAILEQLNLAAIVYT